MAIQSKYTSEEIEELLDQAGQVDDLKSELGNIDARLSSVFTFDVARATIIPSNSDLNDYKQIGNYYVSTVSVATTLSNVPAKFGGRLIVTNINAGSNLLQMYITSTNRIFTRVTDSGNWLDWLEVINAARLASEETALMENTVAHVFSASTAYSVGDYVIYNNKLYRFTAAHAIGAWTGTDATQITIGDDFRSVFTFDVARATIIPSNSDLNDYKQIGNYYVSTVSVATTLSNVPAKFGGRLIVTNINAGSNLLQMYITSTNRIFTRVTDSGNWLDWLEVINAARLASEETALMENTKSIIGVANEGIMAEWDITSTIKATLYNNGLFAVAGTGVAGTSYTLENLPPWTDNKYMRCIKRISFDDRVQYRNINLWFTQYDSNGDPIYYNNAYDGFSITCPRQIASIGQASFGQCDYHHINLTKVETNGQINIAPNEHKRFIISVPRSLCETTNIIDAITTVNMPRVFQNNVNVNNPTANLLVITDDVTLHNAVLDKIDELVDQRGSLCNAWTNCMSILCSELGDDGFPASWTEPMKRCLLELIPYIGRQSQSRETNDPSAETLVFAYDGLTSLGNYSGYGYPHVFSTKSYADVFTTTSSGRRRFAKNTLLGELNNYLGQPFSTSLENLTSGLSCSGLISFLFWRYFNENFALSSSTEYTNGTGPIGNTLPLIEIDRNSVQPFDICCAAYTTTDGGHTALVIGTREVHGEKIIYVLQSLMGIGIVFGTWKLETDSTMTVKYKRFNKAGISENLITFEE